MRVVACVSAYMDAPLLRESLPALRPLVDVVVVVDGRYAQFPDAWHGYASAVEEGTLAVSERFADLIVPPPGGPWPSEIEKRNAYLDRCRPGDLVLVVDADEIVEGTLDREIAATRTDWLVDLYRDEDRELRQPIHRMFKMREGLRYAGTHHAVHVGGALIRPRDLPIFPGLVLRHCQNRRCYQRSAPKADYYRWLDAAERPFRSSPEAAGMDSLPHGYDAKSIAAAERATLVASGRRA